jgi:hypothetical protein
VISSSSSVAPASISLAGLWRFSLERFDEAMSEGWFQRELPESIALPGSLQAQGHGDAVTAETRWTGSILDRAFYTDPAYQAYRQPGNVKLPFWLQPERVYTGPAWYQRTIDIPADWTGRQVWLHLERPHWTTRVWIGSREIGSCDSLSTPHRYCLGPLEPGIHRLSIRVDNRMAIDVGPNAHSVSDHTQGNWNGIVGAIELLVEPAVKVEALRIEGCWADRAIRVTGRMVGDMSGRLTMSVSGVGFDAVLPPVAVAVDENGHFDLVYPLGYDARPWDEFSPALYEIELLAGGERIAVERFGLREIRAEGRQLQLNGRPIFLRGSLECCVHPLTGFPPTDREGWIKIFQAAREHGLNHIRFHSWCPPRAAFIAADELGIYLQVEAPLWANQGATIGNGAPLDAWLHAESERILREYGNHPSFLFFASGNEPDGAEHKSFLGRWVERMRQLDERRLYCCSAGWPELPENDYHVTHWPRIHQWGDGLRSRLNARPPETITDYRAFIQNRSVPVVSHEIGQWCVFPNLAEIEKYRGHLKARNFEIFAERLADGGMAHQAEAFLHASGKLQALCYKEEIESSLRTPGMGGIQLLGLSDFSGQGTALVGVLDAFWESKGYISAAEFRRFCAPTVPLVRLAKRVFTADETLTATVEVAHFGSQAIESAEIDWSLAGDNGEVFASGRIVAGRIEVGSGVVLGEIRAKLDSLPAPCRCRLVVRVEPLGAENDWDLWVYPTTAETADEPPRQSTGSVRLVFDRGEAAASLAAGETVVWSIPPEQAKVAPGDVDSLGFTSIFWNTAWTSGQAPRTLGILCDPSHPALAQFPTESHSNWQWWYLLSRARPLVFDGPLAEAQPLVQVIDDWFTSRKLGLLFEVRAGEGKLLVCSVDLRGELADNPVARQFRSSLLAYAASGEFQPRLQIEPNDLGLFAR